MPTLQPISGTDPPQYAWKYLPSVAAAAIFCGLFLLVTSLHSWRMWKSKTWYCCWVAVGGTLQVLGYAVRILCYWYTGQIATYAIQACFIVIAPVFYAASIYMMLNRVIRSVHGEHFSIVKPLNMTRWFVLGDFVTLNVQGNGAGLTSSSSSTVADVGQWAVVAGLFLQLISFGLFLFTGAIWDSRMRSAGTAAPEESRYKPWKRALIMLYICSVLIIIRSIYRIVEYITGTDGYLMEHEWFAYIFDACPMLAVQVIFVVLYPHQFNPPKVPRAEKQPKKAYRLRELGGFRKMKQDDESGDFAIADARDTTKLRPSQH